MKGKSDRTRYSVYSTFLALILGTYFYSVPIAAEQMHFFYSLPIATYFCAQLGWKLVMKSKESYSFGNIAALSLILTVAVAYLNWMILAIERRLTRDHIDYDGISESIMTTFVYFPLFQTYLSLILVGYVGVILFVLSGFFVIKTKQLK